MIIDHLRLRRTCAIAFVIASLTASSLASADNLSKEVCIDSHSRGQDARDQGKLSLARKLFLTCAQPSCPALVQGDCSRFADDLTRMQPTLSFAARDGSGGDLADTSVFIDEILVATRLDDGRPHDVDPGKHSIKFVHAGKEQVVPIIVGSGEKGRTVSVTFGSPPSPTPSFVQAQAPAPAPVRRAPTTTHAFGSKILVGTGLALVVGGAALGVIGLLQVPANCSVSSHECAAAPGDPAFRDAGSAIQLSNIGWMVSGIGVAAVVGGFTWYFKSGKTPREHELTASPWLTPSGAGIAFSGRL